MHAYSADLGQTFLRKGATRNVDQCKVQEHKTVIFAPKKLHWCAFGHALAFETMSKTVLTLKELCAFKISEHFPIPLSQGEWERKKHRRALIEIDVADNLLELALSFIFGNTVEKIENMEQIEIKEEDM